MYKRAQTHIDKNHTIPLHSCLRRWMCTAGHTHVQECIPSSFTSWSFVSLGRSPCVPKTWNELGTTIRPGTRHAFPVLMAYIWSAQVAMGETCMLWFWLTAFEMSRFSNPPAATWTPLLSPASLCFFFFAGAVSDKGRFLSPPPRRPGKHRVVRLQ